MMISRMCGKYQNRPPIRTEEGHHAKAEKRRKAPEHKAGRQHLQKAGAVLQGDWDEQNSHG